MKFTAEDKKRIARGVEATSKKYGLPTTPKNNKDNKKSK